MASNTLQTDVWIETADPIANLETWQWSFQLTPHPPFTLSTDLWVPEFYNFVNDLTLHTIYMVASNIAGDVQLVNVGKSDDGEPIYYELETQDIEVNSRGVVKQFMDKLGVAVKDASGSHIEIIPNEQDAIAIEIGMGKRVNVITLPSLKGYYVTLRWSGETTNKSPILEVFYLNKVESDGIHE